MTEQSASGPIVELAGVRKSFGSGAAERTVLRGVDWQLAAGEAVAIVGPSGCGKSTLLHLIATLDQPTGGHVRLAGRDVGSMDDAALARLRAESVGIVFQFGHLLPTCTVRENVLVPRIAAAGRATPQDAQRADALLERVGLLDHADAMPASLSGGQYQRAAVVRALINEPLLLLADEPTGALDETSAEELVQLLLELNREKGVSLIMVTHDAEQARRLDAVWTLRDGVLHAESATP